MIRETSIETYHAIKEQGLLSKLRFEVYDGIYRFGPVTQMELCRKLSSGKTQDRSYMPRFAELEKMGVIAAIGKRVCKITGRTVLVWMTTDHFPKKLQKPKRIKCEHCNGKGYLNTALDLQRSTNDFNLHKDSCF